jgi:hypothetical protein
VISASSTTDEVNGTTNDLTIQGSQLKAGNTVTLQAVDQINLLAARDTAEQHSTNSNKSTSVTLFIFDIHSQGRIEFTGCDGVSQ